jgi:hypothetical protein
MERLVFATMAEPGSSAKRALLLFESLRAFGGELKDDPGIILLPKASKPLPDEVQQRFGALNVRLVPFDLTEEAGQFPLASVVYASAEAEAQSKGKAGLLAWMLMDTLVVSPPVAFLVPREISFAYRPVHHTLVGPVYDKPLDSFWSLIYRHCGVTDDRVFPMETCVRDNTLRPYFNSGIFVVRPEQGLLATWRERFERLYRHPDFEPFYRKDVRYRIFIHQAVLAGVVLNIFRKEELQELPEAINYPLHLHDEYPPEHHPAKLNELTTCRYETIEVLMNSLKGIPVEEPMKSWLNERLIKTNSP